MNNPTPSSQSIPRQTKLRITHDGRIQGLWSDDIQLTELGRVHVRRASHVEFDDSQQCWCVRDAARRGWTERWLHRLLGRSARRVLHQAATRDSALAWEHEHFQPGGPGWRPYHSYTVPLLDDRRSE